MKNFVMQSLIILGLSLSIGMAYNQFTKSPLSLFKAYDPHKVVLASADTEGIKDIYFEEVDAEMILSFRESQSAILLDARRTEAFKIGHIPGAASFPIDQFKETYPTVVDLLSEGKIIIVYCKGPLCVDSTHLAIALQNKGHNDIFVYKGGMEDWAELGHPVTNGAGQEGEPQINEDTEGGQTGNNQEPGTEPAGGEGN
ncbi:MAG: hypothetical protein GY765_29755 [bacterium]|nr:hypothetical protein [bacterium]